MEVACVTNTINVTIVTFQNKLIFYGEASLTICPTPTLEDHLLFFNIQ